LRFFLFLLGACAAAASAQEIVTVTPRPGVTQSFFVATMGEVKPEGVALLYVGAGGRIGLRMEEGQLKFGQNNFLPRARREFIRNGILPVVLDTPSDHPNEMSDQFRMSDAHVTDARAVIAEVKKRYPDLPVFIVGTSRGTLSAAYIGVAVAGDVNGVVLTSSYFQTGGKRPRPMLSGFEWHKIRSRLLFVHHADDGCAQTSYREAQRAAREYPLITVHGGKPPESGPCEPFSQHGFLGKEAETVDVIAAWMLGKPFPKEIK
jgi:hypothetical protein